jgi:DNA replication protein DnaC
LPKGEYTADAAITVHGYARLVPCSICNGEDKQADYLRRLCQLKGEELDFTFADYWGHRHGPKPLTAARYVLANNGWMTLTGEPGRGKSFLLCAIVNEARASGKLAVYMRMAHLLDHLRAAYKPGHEVDFDGFWDTVVKAQVLCIDEPEKYNATPWADEKVSEMIQERYRDWHNTVTCFATNAIENCPGWLKSRMLDGRFAQVAMQGPDVRPALERET